MAIREENNDNSKDVYMEFSDTDIAGGENVLGLIVVYRIKTGTDSHRSFKPSIYLHGKRDHMSVIQSDMAGVCELRTMVRWQWQIRVRI